MGPKRWIFVVVLLQYHRSSLASELKFNIPDDWVDPTDMVKFNGRRTNGGKEEAQDEPSQVVEQIQSPQTPDLPDQMEPLGTEQNEPSCKHPFLRRFILVLQKKFPNSGNPPNVENFDISVHLNSKNWNILQEFVGDCKTDIQEVTRVLEDMVTGVHLRLNTEFIWKRKFEDFFHMPFEEFLKLSLGIFLAFALLTMQFVSRISWYTQIKQLFILAFFVSLAMTYIHELKDAEAEYKSKMTTIPEECLPGFEKKASWWDNFKVVYDDMFSVKKDPCVEYHAHYLISPYLKVTPTKVVAVTLTRFFVEPMEHVGTAFSKGFKNIFAGLPVTLWIPAFIFVVLVIVGFLLIVAVFFGYNFSFNLPFWAGLQMGPQQVVQHNPELDRVLEDNRRHIDQLQATIRELRDRPQQQALPAPQPTTSPSKARGILGYFGLGGNTDEPPVLERPNPPAYPAAEPPHDLPYPNFDPPQFRDVGAGDPGAGLRRRHTVPCARPAQDNPAGNLPYPAPDSRQAGRRRAESSNGGQNPIGFEHLVDPSVSDSNTSQLHHRPHILEHMGTHRPVEEVPSRTAVVGKQEKKQSAGKRPHKNSPAKLERVEPETVLVGEVSREQNNDSPEGWEEISAEDDSVTCQGEVNTLEMENLFQQEAVKGFESTG